MKASGLVLWGSLSALALTFSADGCGGRAVLDVPRERGDAGDDAGGSGSSSGFSGSSSGFSGSSSGIDGGGSGSSSGIDGGGSGSSSGVDGGGSGSSSGFSGSSSGFSGSSSGVSGSSSGGSGSSSGSPNGSIYFEECSAPFCQGQSFSVYAQFFTQAQGNGGCTVTAASGACAYYSCSTPPPQNGDSAGTLTVTGPWLTSPVFITPQSGSNAYQYVSSSPGFSAGQTLGVSASGAMVPGFPTQSVVAPDLTLLTNPPIGADGGTTVIPTGADLPVTWSGGQSGATMLLEAVGSNGQSYTYCSWNGSDGKGIIPAATLQPLSGNTGYVIYGQYNSTQFFAGPYDITLSALPYTGGAVQFQ